MKFAQFLSMFGLSLVLYMTLSHAAVPSKSNVRRVRFNQDGSIQIPVGYRQWAHVGTRYKSSGNNLLDGSPLTTPQIMNAYIEPSAMLAFEKTGEWPDGTQIVKEFSEIRTGKDCDDNTRVCTTDLGQGIFQTEYSGLAMMVKDKQHFPNEAGNWAYFGFGHQPPPYKTTAKVFPTEQCASCHIKNAAESGYVFTRAHIGLAGTTR